MINNPITIGDIDAAATSDRAKPSPWVLSNRHAWAFYNASYIGGPAYKNSLDAAGQPVLMKRPAESATKLSFRKSLAVYSNYSRPALRIHIDSVFSERISRSFEPDQPSMDAFTADVDLRGGNAREFMDTVAAQAMVFGWVPVGIDRFIAAPEPVSRAAADSAGNRPYWLWVRPQMVRRLSVEPRTGQLTRITWVESFDRRKDGKVHLQLIEWTADGWQRFDETGRVTEEGAHGFGRVPFVLAQYDASDTDGRRGLMHDLADINKAIFNLDSNWNTADAYAGDPLMVFEGFSDLDAASKTAVKSGVGSVLQLPENANAKYLQPDPSYATNYALRRQRLLDDFQRAASLSTGFAVETQNAASGISKAFDFHQTAQQIAYLARQMERAETELWRLWARAEGRDPTGVNITYPQEFNLTAMGQRVTEFLDFISTNPPDLVKREKMKSLIRRDDDLGDHPALGAMLDAVDEQDLSLPNVDPNGFGGF